VCFFGVLGYGRHFVVLGLFWAGMNADLHLKILLKLNSSFEDNTTSDPGPSVGRTEAMDIGYIKE
jgi:hypothetical protein